MENKQGSPLRKPQDATLFNNTSAQRLRDLASKNTRKGVFTVHNKTYNQSSFPFPQKSSTCLTHSPPSPIHCLSLILQAAALGQELRAQGCTGSNHISAPREPRFSAVWRLVLSIFLPPSLSRLCQQIRSFGVCPTKVEPWAAANRIPPGEQDALSPSKWGSGCERVLELFSCAPL